MLKVGFVLAFFAIETLFVPKSAQGDNLFEFFSSEPRETDLQEDITLLGQGLKISKITDELKLMIPESYFTPTTANENVECNIILQASNDSAFYVVLSLNDRSVFSTESCLLGDGGINCSAVTIESLQLVKQGEKFISRHGLQPDDLVYSVELRDRLLIFKTLIADGFEVSVYRELRATLSEDLKQVIQVVYEEFIDEPLSGQWIKQGSVIDGSNRALEPSNQLICGESVS